jgi:acetolactate synthase-1/2/3 large subunit
MKLHKLPVPVYRPPDVPAEEAADGLLALFHANGVKYIFINPGSDLVPILESAARFKLRGLPAPEFILCQHESLAMTAAHGYFMATGKPQAVLVHLDVGTLQVGGSLHNAQRGYAGIIFCAGLAPWTFEGERRGGRFSSIDFRMEQADQAGIVRQYVKWAHELKCADNMHHIIQRAFQVAQTEPCGPVYLTLPREVLMEKITSVKFLPEGQYGAAISPAGDFSALRETARLLAKARNPLCITNSLGRHRPSVAPFVELCNLVGMRVATPNLRMNFPTNHPLWAESSPNPYLKEADVILVIDTQVPWVYPNQHAPDAKVIHIDMDPVKSSMPLSNFPADLRIFGDSSKAIPLLLDMVKEYLSSADKARARARLASCRREDAARRLQWDKAALASKDLTPIAPEWLGWCLGQEIKPEDILVDEGIGYWTQTRRHIVRTLPGTTYHTDGCSLGWGIGSALGIKLAEKDRTVICLCGDGSFIYGQPIPTLWASARYQAPFLTVVLDNGGYRAMDSMMDILYGPGSNTAKSGQRIATRFNPAPDYAAVARACGAWAEAVTDPALLRPALHKGLTKVRSGQPAVVSVKLTKY